MTPTRRHPPGIAMMLVMIAMVIATVMAMGFMYAQSTTTQVSRNAQGTTTARVIAESGLAMALQQVQADPGWRATHPNGVWVSNAAFDGGTLTVRGQRDSDGDGTIEAGETLSDDSDQPIVITATGSAGGITHTVRANVTVAGGAAFTPGIAVTDTVELDSYGAIDSYDSSRGAYSSTNKGAEAVVSTNSTAAGKIEVAGGAALKGSAYAGKGGSPSSVITVSGGGQVTGSRSVLGDPVTIPASVTVPSVSSGLLGDLVTWLGLVEITSDRHYSNILLALATMRVNGNVKIVVENNLTMLLGGKIELTPGSRLELYVKRATNISSGAAINSATNAPGQVIFYNAGVDDITISNAVLSAYVISPSGELRLSGGADFYGTFRGAGVRVSGSGTTLHHDISGHIGSRQQIDFDDYSTGNAHNQDGWVKPAAYTVNANAQIVSSGGSKVLRVGSPAEATAVYRSFSMNTGQTALRVRWFWKPTSASVHQVVGLMAADRSNAAWSDLSVRIQMDHDGTFKVNGAGGNNVAYSTAGNWCDLVVTGLNTPTSAKVSFYVDGRAVSENRPLQRNPGSYALNRFVVKADTSGGSSGGQEVDHISFGDSAGTITGSAASVPTYTSLWWERP